LDSLQRKASRRIDPLTPLGGPEVPKTAGSHLCSTDWSPCVNFLCWTAAYGRLVML
jgi:hypothetical protein